MPSILDVMFGLTFDLTNYLCLVSNKLSDELTPMHVRVLRAVQPNPNATVNTVATTLRRDKAQITRLANSLLAQDLLQRAPNPSDGRSQLLSLTNKGQILFRQVEEIDTEIRETMLAGISQKEAEVFLEVAVKMSRNLDNANSSGTEADRTE
jgi:DNA-binding MarR family transcriptional regulator